MPINTAPDIHQNVICANVFIRKDDKYLVLKRSPLKKYAPGYVHPVGGKVDLHENPYQAAVREVAEETGVSIENLKLEAVILEIAPPKDRTDNWLIFHFSAEYKSGEVITTEEGELVWLTKEEIKEANLFPSVRVTIDSILDSKKGTVFVTCTYDENEQVQVVESATGICSI